ncbi:TATA-binding_protein (TBP) [Hexamita inflata]|uniref:TATA-binding protein (TBP) n=1 Tax=Hexamita inflata TaxID=28002 RepID=A0AA86P703_9EUKA|nr:TATA-binding protein (TBP) [Hexamita inflata]
MTEASLQSNQEQISKMARSIKFKIENYTALANFDSEMDLGVIFSNIKNSNVRTTNTCVQFDIFNASTQVKIYQSGACLVIGCQSLQQVEQSFKIISKLMRKIQQPHILKQYSIYQTLASGFFPRPIYLELLFKVLQNSHYDPEIFPGLMYRNQEKDLPFHLTIMGNGSFVIGGLAGEEEIVKAIISLLPDVQRCYCEAK